MTVAAPERVRALRDRIDAERRNTPEGPPCPERHVLTPKVVKVIRRSVIGATVRCDRCGHPFHVLPRGRQN